MEKYIQAPLPFMGQKRRFAKQFAQVINNLPNNTTIVDLFGGSGLLSHIAKKNKPDAKVVYNDYDNYRQRLDNIPATNSLLSDLRCLTDGYPRNTLIRGELREAIIDCINRHAANGYVDYITLSSSLLFSSKYVTSYDQLIKQGFYNNVTSKVYCADGYLDGIEVVSCDYAELAKRYAHNDNILLVVDPPYLLTETAHYNMNWTLSDYLDVVNILQGHRYIYFTSNKSMVTDLCDWVSTHSDYVNPFAGATTSSMHCTLNYSAKYTDIMLVKTE